MFEPLRIIFLSFVTCSCLAQVIDSSQCCQCSPGPAGVPGVPGSAGSPGSAGVPGSAGSVGPPGIQGPPGPKGDTGIKGDIGAKGQTGQKGDGGAQGPKGDIGQKGEQETVNDLAGFRGVKQCVWPSGINEGKDTGVIKECNFVKTKQVTGLRVAYYGDLRAIGKSAGVCSRWYFTINGAECSSPGSIAVQILSNDENDNHHRPAAIEGICEGIPQGPVKVTLNIGGCAGHTTADGDTGWAYSARIVLEEVNLLA